MKNENAYWLELIPSGWTGLAYKMIEECEAIDPTFEVIGYDNNSNDLWLVGDSAEEYHEQIVATIRKYAEKSKHICCQCGAPAKRKNYFMPFCEKCHHQTFDFQ